MTYIYPALLLLLIKEARGIKKKLNFFQLRNLQFW